MYLVWLNCDINPLHITNLYQGHCLDIMLLRCFALYCTCTYSNRYNFIQCIYSNVEYKSELYYCSADICIETLFYYKKLDTSGRKTLRNILLFCTVVGKMCVTICTEKNIWRMSGINNFEARFVAWCGFCFLWCVSEQLKRNDLIFLISPLAQC